MPFAAKDFHILAIWLIQQRTDEASLRTAISRVYYAGHLLAVERLVPKGWSPTGSGQDHNGIIRQLTRGKTRHLANKLRRLYEFRQHADYHVEATATVRNQDCQFCAQIRGVLPAKDVVNESHWEEVQEIGQDLLHFLEQL
jgi:hypothetical protein